MNLVTEQILSASFNANSSLVLFDGLRNFNTLQRAKLSQIGFQYRLLDLQDDIKLNVANSYLNILLSKEVLKNNQALLAEVEKELERTNEQFEAGVAPKGDVLEIEATVATRQQQVINSENSVMLAN